MHSSRPATSSACVRRLSWGVGPYENQNFEGLAPVVGGGSHGTGVGLRHGIDSACASIAGADF
jgi:hypothetical protein